MKHTTGNSNIVNFKGKEEKSQFPDTERNSDQNKELKLKPNALWTCGRMLKTRRSKYGRGSLSQRKKISTEEVKNYQILEEKVTLRKLMQTVK